MVRTEPIGIAKSSKNEDRLSIVSKERIFQAGPPQTRMARGMYWENKHTLAQERLPITCVLSLTSYMLQKTSRWDCLWVENIALY